jgi:hypothetical protein
MSFAASSSSASEREERVFTAAFGLMDSGQDGEAIAAFMRVRELLHRHGSGFRRLLERSQEAERLNEELGRQNVQLLHENAALRARDSRPVSATAIGSRSLFFMTGKPASRHWDIGLVVIIAAWVAFGLLGATTALTLAAAVLICAAFTNWFSPFRLFIGAILGIAAYGMVETAPATTPAAPASAYAVAEPTPQRQISTAVTSPVVARPAPDVTTPAPAGTTPSTAADAVPPRRPDNTPLPTQALADPPRLMAADLLRRSPGEQGTRHAARADCGPYRLQPGFNCTRGHQWRRDSFLDFGHSFNLLE